MGAAGPKPSPLCQQIMVEDANIRHITKISSERSQSCRQDRQGIEEIPQKIKSFSFSHRPSENSNTQLVEEGKRRNKDREHKHERTEERESVEKEKRKSKKRETDMERTESVRSQVDLDDEQGNS